jgi:hypothetical protein
MEPQILTLLRSWMGWLRDVFSPRTQDQMLTLLACAILTPGNTGGQNWPLAFQSDLVLDWGP